MARSGFEGPQEGQRADGRGRSGTVSFGPCSSPKGKERSPHLRARCRWGDWRYWRPRSLTTDGCVCVQQQALSIGVAGGRVAFSRETATPGWGVIRSSCHVGRQRCRSGAVAQSEAHPTVYRGVAGSSPVGSALGRYGFCSSPVERLVEAQRAAGSTPAEAIAEARALETPPWRNGRRATLRTSWARPVGVQVPPAAWHCRVAQRESGGLISRDWRGFESRPCNRSCSSVWQGTRLVTGRSSGRNRPGAPVPGA